MLAADTVVALGRRALPKAEDRETARACLEAMSGRRHTVYGGIALIAPEAQSARAALSEGHRQLAANPTAIEERFRLAANRRAWAEGVE